MGLGSLGVFSSSPQLRRRCPVIITLFFSSFRLSHRHHHSDPFYKRTRVCFIFTRCGHRPPKVDTPHRTVTAYLKWTRCTHLAFSGSCRLSAFFFFQLETLNYFITKSTFASKGRTATAHLMWTHCTHWSFRSPAFFFS